MDTFLKVSFCVGADGLQGLSKVFHCPIQLLSFYLLFLNDLLILKMLTETLLRTPFSVASWKHFQCQNHRFWVFEAGYWKDFQH
jgi:hypothetical protein